ncbi:MAG: hemin-degrading factor [Bacterioplanes sp.]|nr:hemin-degrading factor [Bacterioplanes sp.]
MNQMAIESAVINDLAERWQQLLQRKGSIRIRNAADELGVSEAELLATRIGHSVVRLQGDFAQLMGDIKTLGPVMALTRNDVVVHEKTGAYDKVSVHGHMGLALGVIDLRLFFNRFVYGFAVEEGTEQGIRRSLQFFAGNGEAVHKIYAVEGTDIAAFQALVNRYWADDQRTGLSLQHEDIQPEPRWLATPTGIDKEQLHADWCGLKDVHHFQAMLQRHGIERIPAYQLVGEEFAQRLPVMAFEQVLITAAQRELSIMVFVGSQGVVQIHTGTVQTLKRTGPWFNVLDSDFNLHANTELIDQVWLVRKPTTDGVVTALEMFDAQGRQVAQVFGERKPGKPEQTAWVQLLADVQQSCELGA